MSASNISKVAYKEITKSGQSNTQLNIILNHLILHGSKTRRQLSKELEIETSTLVRELINLKNYTMYAMIKQLFVLLAKRLLD